MDPRRILVVDDEPNLLQLLEKHLTRLGYQVSTAPNGSAALALLDDNPHCCDLVVSDWTLPDMRGADLLEAIGQRRPDVPLLVCSGMEVYPGELPESVRARAHQLQKPFLPRELSDLIARLLPQ